MENTNLLRFSTRCIAILVVLFFSACQEQVDFEPLNQEENNFVDIELAQDLASSILYAKVPVGNSGARTSKSFATKEVDTLTPIPDEEGNAAYYIADYADGGFLILSGDNRVNPVLAFSGKSNFLTNETDYPEGLKEWFSERMSFVKQVRNSNRRQSKEMARLWHFSSIQNIVNSSQLDGIKAPDPETDPIDPDDPCDDYTVTFKGPLLNTNWGQLGVYNDLIPLNGCANNPPTGCVATAMAQVMKYYEFPSSYNWSAMPDGAGSLETAQLMLDIGWAVNMDWGCASSSTTTSTEAASSFKYDFGYSTASYTNYNINTVKQQLDWNRPVILRGSGTDGGHAWVCDGYKEIDFCGPLNNLYYLHMNWGWNSWYNDYYLYNDWTPSSYSFNTGKGMVYNIAP